MRDRFRALTRSDRLRAIGWLLLASGAIAAAVVYWIAARSLDPAMDDATALGYSRSFEHGMGVMMGRSGVILTEWQQRLTSPLGEAILVLVAAALFAGYFFRVAWVIDEEERDARN